MARLAIFGVERVRLFTPRQTKQKKQGGWK